jgi:glutamate carboxypeptidase
MELFEFFTSQQSQLLALLQELVAIESPTHNFAAVNRMADRVGREIQLAGGQLKRIPGLNSGDMLLGSWSGFNGQTPILILCHMDTVWPLGSLADLQTRVDGDRFYGPGAYDMKGGIVVALGALRGLQELGIPLPIPVTLLCTADEETGSHTSRAMIESLARQSQLVLCLEPSLPGGVLKTARKGVGQFDIRVEGRPAHAGSDHPKGINAIEEIAHLVLQLQALTDYGRGTTVNVGVIQGGSASNVVPAVCQAEVDFRVTVPEEAERLQTVVAGMRPRHPKARLMVQGGLNRPPMVRDERMAATFHKAQQIAKQHGLSLHEAATGGASDANFTAPLGVPTLDGLGVDGDGGHALHEHARISSLPERAGLLAALLTEW